MPYLYELIQQKVIDWRRQGYPTEGYPAIAEILDYATLPESEGLRYLRQAQLRAGDVLVPAPRGGHAPYL
jgi:hypothetical protein